MKEQELAIEKEKINRNIDLWGKIAEEYITRGALWNSGIFAYKISYILGIDNYLNQELIMR